MQVGILKHQEEDGFGTAWNCIEQGRKKVIEVEAKDVKTADASTSAEKPAETISMVAKVIESTTQDSRSHGDNVTPSEPKILKTEDEKENNESSVKSLK